MIWLWWRERTVAYVQQFQTIEALEQAGLLITMFFGGVKPLPALKENVKRVMFFGGVKPLPPTNLLKGRKFWEINLKMQNGSWMWHKILKMGAEAKLFYQKELGNGRCISFWFDTWSKRGPIFDLLGPRGIIDMGVSRYANLEEATHNVRRRRKHRNDLLNDLEGELNTIVSKLRPEKEDVSVWRGKSGFKKRFSSRKTWLLLRENKPKCNWSCGVWFPQHTSKFAFITWLSIKNRLSTLDRVANWSQGVDTTCVLCKSDVETRSHLFFECGYSSQIWESITKGVLGSSYTKKWDEILLIIADEKREKLSRFCIRYTFQTVLYAVWCERNKVMHGEKLLPLQAIEKVD